MKQSKVLQWVVWSVLVAVIFGVVLAYLVDVRRGLGLASGIGAHGSSLGKLPVIKTLGEFSLTNQHGSEISTRSLKGAPWVANIFFTRCPSICVQMTQRMKEIQDAIGADQSLKLVSITTDPDFDQPEILEKYSRRFDADQERWAFLTGEKSEIANAIQKELLLAVQENKESERQSELDLFTHSSLLVLVDGESRLRGTYESMGTNIVETIIADLDRL